MARIKKDRQQGEHSLFEQGLERIKNKQNPTLSNVLGHYSLDSVLYFAVDLTKAYLPQLTTSNLDENPYQVPVCVWVFYVEVFKDNGISLWKLREWGNRPDRLACISHFAAFLRIYNSKRAQKRLYELAGMEYRDN